MRDQERTLKAVLDYIRWSRFESGISSKAIPFKADYKSAVSCMLFANDMFCSKDL